MSIIRRTWREAGTYVVNTCSTGASVSCQKAGMRSRVSKTAFVSAEMLSFLRSTNSSLEWVSEFRQYIEMFAYCDKQAAGQ